LVAVVVVVIGVGLLREELWRYFRLPLRAMQLAAQPPDIVLGMPVAGVSPRAVADTWSAPRPGGRQHEGQDIFAKRGTPVVSATRGIVVRVGENTLGGRVVSVLGPGRRVYYYAHLDRHAEGLAAGIEVQPGTLLGYVGNSGNARTTPAHLHFGVYTPEGAVNPLPLLRGPVHITLTAR
jgi:murein DD-endopeptidase MepM/ murein hydrolase activator NlpD